MYVFDIRMYDVHVKHGMAKGANMINATAMCFFRFDKVVQITPQLGKWRESLHVHCDNIVIHTRILMYIYGYSSYTGTKTNTHTRSNNKACV